VVAKGTLKYPPSAQEEGIEGTVRLKVLVVETGSVAEVEIDVSSGDRRLDAAAKQWVQGWRYRPAAQNGKPRRVQTYATVEFELR
jgi:protein TonB